MANPSPRRPTQSGPQARNSVRLDHAQLDQFLNEREAARSGEKAPGRAFVRLPFRVATVELKLVHPGQSEATVVVACYNLSAGGLGVLHSAYVYPGTKCLVRLPNVDGRKVDVPGVVVRCQHARGVVHDVGIRFNAPIEARDFVRLDPFADGFVLEKVDPEQLKGTVLFIGESALDQSVVRHFLRQTHVTLEIAATPREAEARVMEGVDLILCDNDRAAGDAATIVRTFRESGVPTPIIMLTADTSRETREMLVRAKANAFISKPLKQDMLFRAMAEFMVVDESASVFSSSLPLDHPNRGLLESFIQQVHAQADQLGVAMKAGDAARCRSLCLQIAGTAPVMGFEKLAAMAHAAEGALASASAIADAAAPLNILVSSCKRASARAAA